MKKFIIVSCVLAFLFNIVYSSVLLFSQPKEQPDTRFYRVIVIMKEEFNGIPNADKIINDIKKYCEQTQTTERYSAYLIDYVDRLILAYKYKQDKSYVTQDFEWNEEKDWNKSPLKKYIKQNELYYDILLELKYYYDKIK